MRGERREKRGERRGEGGNLKGDGAGRVEGGGVLCDLHFSQPESTQTQTRMWG